MIEIIIDFIILEAAKDPTNKRIDVERERGSISRPPLMITTVIRKTILYNNKSLF